MTDTAVQLSRSQVPSVPEALTPDDVMAQVHLIQHVMERAMKKDEHYGVIPGTGNKPTLLKAGAEKLNLTFRMAPDPQVEVIDLGKGHREYRVKVVMASINTGKILGAGVGSASTMETKWRFRSGPGESTGRTVPKEYWDLRTSDPKKAQELIGGKGYVTKKEEGIWMVFRQGERVEHDNPADYYNTCLKMAKKRALVDAVLTVTAASDIFTQDIEEMVENEIIVPSAAVPPASAPAAEPGVDATQPPAPTPSGEKKSVDELRKELDELCDIACDAALFINKGAAVQWATSTEKFQSKCRDVSGLTKDWMIERAIKKLLSRMNAPKSTPADDDQAIPPDLFQD